MRFALVEDECKWVKTFKDYIQRYGKENDVAFGLDVFPDGIDFISDYNGGYDLIFMDIAMPHMNGMEAAARLRQTDENVCLVFTTTLAQYALKGYEVGAFDFLVKPMEYDLFKIKLDKALRYISKHNKKTYNVVTANGMRKIPLSEINYIESAKHYLYFHTDGEEYKMRASLEDIKAFFKENAFAEINRSLLVNLARIDGYTNTEVLVAGENLPLSRIYKTDFLNKLTSYLGGNF
jgi:DNA-binding LytR/AlgR family response regulator